MWIQKIGRYSLLLGIAVALTGCVGSRTKSKLFNECTFNRQACMYDGSYEPGEEQYAEEEARRLNKAQMR
jgi:hypothetical protein